MRTFVHLVCSHPILTPMEYNDRRYEIGNYIYCRICEHYSAPLDEKVTIRLDVGNESNFVFYNDKSISFMKYYILSFKGKIGYKFQENMKTYLENYDMDCDGERRADIQWSTQ